MENEKRAGYGEEAVQAFQAATGQHEEEMQTVMGDLICDLIHFCDQQSVDFEACMWSGRNHYKAEITEDGLPCGEGLNRNIPVQVNASYDARHGATLLAALRHWQRSGNPEVYEHFEPNITPLNIEALCERINCGE